MTATFRLRPLCFALLLSGFAGSASATLDSASVNSLGFTINFTDLTVNGKNLSGTIVITAMEGSISWMVDIAYSADTDNVMLTFDGQIANDENGYTLNGRGTFESAVLSADFTLENLHKSNLSQCYGDAGSVLLETKDLPDITVTLNEQTPVTGEVSVQIGSLPATTEALPACGAEHASQ